LVDDMSRALRHIVVVVELNSVTLDVHETTEGLRVPAVVPRTKADEVVSVLDERHLECEVKLVFLERVLFPLGTTEYQSVLNEVVKPLGVLLLRPKDRYTREVSVVVVDEVDGIIRTAVCSNVSHVVVELVLERKAVHGCCWSGRSPYLLATSNPFCPTV